MLQKPTYAQAHSHTCILVFLRSSRFLLQHKLSQFTFKSSPLPSQITGNTFRQHSGLAVRTNTNYGIRLVLSNNVFVQNQLSVEPRLVWLSDGGVSEVYFFGNTFRNNTDVVNAGVVSTELVRLEFPAAKNGPLRIAHNTFINNAYTDPRARHAVVRVLMDQSTWDSVIHYNTFQNPLTEMEVALQFRSDAVSAVEVLTDVRFNFWGESVNVTLASLQLR
jgi:hypothetical protein